MIIGFDLDGVLVDFDAVFLDLASKETGIKYTHEDVTKYNHASLKGMSISLQEKIFNKLKSRQNFFYTLPEFSKHDIDEVCRFSKKNILYFITNRFPCPTNEDTLQQTINWLKDRNISFAGVIMAKHKATVCAKIGIETYLDDYPRMAKSINANGYTRCYLMDRPYNREYETPNRVHSIKEFLNIR